MSATERNGRLVCTRCNRETEHEGGSNLPEWALCDECGDKADREGIPHCQRGTWAYYDGRTLDGGARVDRDTGGVCEGCYQSPCECLGDDAGWPE